MYTILLNLIHEYIFFCSSCCCYCRNKILKIKPTVFLCLHSGGWTGEKNNYCKKTFRTACDMNMAMHAKICLLFCHLVQKKKMQSMLNSIPVWPVCSSDFNKTSLWQMSTFFLKELGLLNEFSKCFFCPWLSYIRTEQNSRWFFFKKIQPFTLVVNKIDIKVGIGMLKSHIWTQLNIMVYSIIFMVFLSVL